MAKTATKPRGGCGITLLQAVNDLVSWVDAHLRLHLSPNLIAEITSLDAKVYALATTNRLSIPEPISDGRKYYESPADPKVTHFGYTKIPRRAYRRGPVIVGFEEWSTRMRMVSAAGEALDVARKIPSEREQRTNKADGPAKTIARSRKGIGGKQQWDHAVGEFEAWRHDTSNANKTDKQFISFYRGRFKTRDCPTLSNLRNAINYRKRSGVCKVTAARVEN